jgi:hypothetical protein
MSNLLEQAIVDAAALREVALKNAEAALIEKYSKEFKESVEKLLEQEAAPAPVSPDAAASIAAADPLASPTPTPAGAESSDEKEKAFKGVKSSFLEGDEEELITIDFDQLKKQLKSAIGGEENTLAAPPPAQAPAPEAAPAPVAPLAEGVDEQEEIEEEFDLEESYEAGGQEDMAEDALTAEEQQEEDKLLKKKKKNGDTMPPESVDEYQFELEEGLPASFVEDLASEAEELEEDAAAAAPIAQQIAALQKQLADLEAKQAAALAQPAAAAPASASAKPLEEDIEITTEELAELAERLNVDIHAENLSDGHMGTTVTQKREQRNLELAQARGEKEKTRMEEEDEAMSDLKEKLDEAIEIGSSLVEENEDLNSKISEMEEYLYSLKENVEKLSISNAKLLYTNKILVNGSLNERQKQQIVENISKCNSVLEAKTVYNALQSGVSSSSETKRAKESLSESLNRSNSPFLTRKSQTAELSFADRMKKLAGITSQS